VRGESLQVLGVLLATRLVLGVLLARHERRELRGNTEVCTSGLAPSNGGGGDGVGWRMGWTWASGMHVMIMQRTGVQSRFGVYSRELGWLLAQGRFVQRLSSFAAQTAACSSSACWLVILIGAGSSEVGARSPGAEVGISFVCISYSLREQGLRRSAAKRRLDRCLARQGKRRENASSEASAASTWAQATKQAGQGEGSGHSAASGYRREAKLSRAQACS
jgi:hypothetical protein